MTWYALVNVWDGETWAYFPTWEEANEYAERIYRETGEPLYIEEEEETLEEFIGTEVRA